jgi:hypothetical protein
MRKLTADQRRKRIYKTESDHGLGIGTVEAVKVEELEKSIWSAATQALALRVPFGRFIDLCEGAMDVARFRVGHVNRRSKP